MIRLNVLSVRVVHTVADTSVAHFLSQTTKQYVASCASSLFLAIIAADDASVVQHNVSYDSGMWKRQPLVC